MLGGKAVSVDQQLIIIIQCYIVINIYCVSKNQIPTNNMTTSPIHKIQ